MTKKTTNSNSSERKQSTKKLPSPLELVAFYEKGNLIASQLPDNIKSALGNISNRLTKGDPLMKMGLESIAKVVVGKLTDGLSNQMDDNTKTNKEPESKIVDLDESDYEIVK